MKSLNRKNLITSKDLYRHFYADVAEYHRLISILLSESHRFRFKKGLGMKLNEDEISHVTSSSLLKLLDQVHKKEANGEVIHDLCAYYAKSYEHELYNYLNCQNTKIKRTVYLCDFSEYANKSEELVPELHEEAEVQLKQYLKSLNEKEQLIIKLQFSDKMSQKEIAESLHMSPDSIKTTLFRAMQKLRKLINGK